MERILPGETVYDGVPYVGCAATIPVGSDAYPGTVSWVSDSTVKVTTKAGIEYIIPRKLKIKYCEARGVPGWNNAFTENQKYTYYEDDSVPQREREYSYRDKVKGYVEVGTPSASSAAQRLSFGVRVYYRDPHF